MDVSRSSVVAGSPGAWFSANGVTVSSAVDTRQSTVFMTEDAGVDVVNPVAADIEIRRVVLSEIDAVHNLRSVGFARYGYVGGMFRGAGLIFLLLGADACNLSLPVLQ